MVQQPGRICTEPTNSRWADLPPDDDNRDMEDGLARPIKLLSEPGAVEQMVESHPLVVLLLHYPWCTKCVRPQSGHDMTSRVLQVAQAAE